MAVFKTRNGDPHASCYFTVEHDNVTSPAEIIKLQIFTAHDLARVKEVFILPQS